MQEKNVKLFKINIQSKSTYKTPFSNLLLALQKQVSVEVKLNNSEVNSQNMKHVQLKVA